MSEQTYLALMGDLLTKGVYREGRNGGTYSLFGAQMRFDLAKGFPLLTTKKVHLRSIIVELLWFLRGDTNVQFLHDHGVTIWDEWADDKGNLGPVYGKQWRSWATGKKGPMEILERASNGEACRIRVPDITIDQISNVVAGLKADPYSRRHIVSAWNPAEVDSMALPPCHTMFQFYVVGNKLSCQLYQRSADWFLGVPFNIASYALLTMMMAKECGLELGEFVHTFGDYHLYDDHREQALQQLQRTPKAFPTMKLADGKGLFEYTVDDFTLIDYEPESIIRAPVRK